jgi:3-isopropylmalate/(R)-2-methylmalate dehydratase small subunit
MEPLRKHTGLVAALNRANIDTDQIIPKQFLKRIERTGFGDFLFFDWRFFDDGKPNPDFELNQPKYEGATILISGANFGCGSSREHAPWALLDYGFKVLIAPSFADIFYNNCFKNGILPIVLPDTDIEQLRRKAETTEGFTLTVDLANQTIQDDTGSSIAFEIEPFRREYLLKGLDDIGLTLEYASEITRYESERKSLT